MKPKLRRAWELAQEYWFDILIVGGLAWWLADIALYFHSGNDGEQGPLWFDLLAVLFFTLPLLARRRYPVASLVTAGLAIAIASPVDINLVKHPFISFLFGLTIAFRFGMRPNRRVGLIGLAFVIGVAVVVELSDGGGAGGQLAWDAITFTVSWIIGFAVGEKYREVDLAKERAERAEREREERARSAVADERARIARELHDVVGHSVSVMTVQASAVRRRLDDDQEQIRDALEIVEKTGREALAEMRRMVGVLRRPDESAPLEPARSLEPEPPVELTAEGGSA